MFNVTMVGDRELVLRLRGMPAGVAMAMERTVTRLSLELTSYIKDQKLSGQVLKVVTGALRRSVAYSVAVTGLAVMGRVFTSKDTIKYAGAHEFGFDGEVTVREHLRTVVFGRDVAPFTVPAHARMMHVPERSYMRSSLEDKHAYIAEELRNAAYDSVRVAVGGAA